MFVEEVGPPVYLPLIESAAPSKVDAGLLDLSGDDDREGRHQHPHDHDDRHDLDQGEALSEELRGSGFDRGLHQESPVGRAMGPRSLGGKKKG